MESSGIRKRAAVTAALLAGILLALPASAQVPEPVQEDAEVQPRETDAWGAPRNFGLAAAETILANLIPWAFNEFPRGSSIAQINPGTWARNFEEGFGWDDNNFSTNQVVHPFHGSLYFNAARSNGFSFWESAPWAFAGSLTWECCGESHLMSLNDLINTGMGGIALGEVWYRTSSLVLDNTARGSERAWREVGGFLLDPVRGFSRLVSGRTTRVYDNPADSRDKRPDVFSNRMLLGLRGYSENIGLTDPVYNGFLSLDMQYGAPLQIERHQPFDFFLLSAQINLQDKKPLGMLTIRGNLYWNDLGNSGDNHHRFMITQNFDYVNNAAYESGGQSISAGVLSRWELGEPGGWSLGTTAEGLLSPMTAVNSDFAFVADVPGVRENYRDYDFGLAGGARVGTSLVRGGDRLLDVVYSAVYVNTLNGSEINGSDAWHILQRGMARVVVPVRGDWALGADYEVFLRNSHYSFDQIIDTVQKSPQFRVFLSWKLGDSGPTGIGG